MFASDTYIARRKKLTEAVSSGVILFPGNNDSPMNYLDNFYPFRQDSSFLYYWGLDSPGLSAVIDVDAGMETIYGNELTVDDVIWMGAQPSLGERSRNVGVDLTKSRSSLQEDLQEAQRAGRTVHYLPQYRADLIILLADTLGLAPEAVNTGVSEEMLHEVIRQRSVKTDEELLQIEIALEATYEMHTYAMRHARPGRIEREIVGAMQGIAVAGGGNLAFPVIFSVHGETLHNHSYGNTMQAGELAVCDCGAESAMHYAGDITRTIPVSGAYNERQREVYQIVLDAQLAAIEAIKPGARFVDIHLLSARVITSGLKDLGLITGDADEVVAAGAHALFFPHGLGHMMGLDVHDMEGLGEDLVGYDDKTKRSEQFGLSALRFGKSLQPGYVMTVEPGIYFIPQLIDLWHSEGKFSEFLNYEKIAAYKGFGGIRIEDNVAITGDGMRVLGKPVPKTIADVESMAAN